MTSGLPQAPWRPPEPPRRSATTLLIALVVTMVAIPVVAVVGLFGWGFYVYAGHDRIELIEHPSTVEALERPCADMRIAAGELDLEGPPPNQAESLLTFSSAARVIPETVAALDAELVADDLPTENWGRDWATLLDSIDVYARSLESGGPATFVMPRTADDDPIDRRMDWAEPGGCQVPDVLTGLSPPPTPPV